MIKQKQNTKQFSKFFVKGSQLVENEHKTNENQEIK
jgi:hypothetical protein